MSYDAQLKRLHEEAKNMREQAAALRSEVERWTKEYWWSEWEPHTVGIIPVRINGHWYFKGDTVYRKEKMRGLSGSRQYRYGDEFDLLKDKHDDV